MSAKIFRSPSSARGPIGLAAAAHLIERGFRSNSTKPAQTSARTCATGRMCASSRRGAQCRRRAAPLAGSTAGSRPSRTACRPATRSIATISSRWRRHRRCAAHRHRREGRAHRAARQRQESQQGPRGEAVRPAVDERRRRSAPRLARAVIDASGTWPKSESARRRRPAGRRRSRARDRIAYGIPDVLGASVRAMPEADRRRRRRLFGATTCFSISPSFARTRRKRDHLDRPRNEPEPGLWRRRG